MVDAFLIGRKEVIKVAFQFSGNNVLVQFLLHVSVCILANLDDALDISINRFNK